jgi:hypothetical protein
MDVASEKPQPETGAIDHRLTLYTPSRLPVTLQVANVFLRHEEDAITECRLILHLTSNQYHQIETAALFNLKPELRMPLGIKSFQDEPAIAMEVALQAQLLLQLAEHEATAEAALDYLLSLSQQYADDLSECSQQADSTDSAGDPITAQPALNPLLSTESWFALNVKQSQGPDEVGYRTFWSYANPANLTPEMVASGQFSEAMEQFFKDRAEAGAVVAGEAIAGVFDELLNSLKGLEDSDFLKETEKAISDVFEEVAQAVEEWVEASETPLPAATANIPIYQAMLTFFSEDDWAFTKLKGEPTLRLAAQGNHGQWDCYAKALDERSQFVFYSICPTPAPEAKRAPVSEFLARANYGLVLGNFELDFDDGEIRYKTSLDATHQPIRSAAIKQLVYTNIMTMDQYLPGLLAVIEQDMEPREAIQRVESQDMV